MLCTLSSFAVGTLAEFSGRDKKGALGIHVKALDVRFHDVYLSTTSYRRGMYERKTLEENAIEQSIVTQGETIRSCSVLKMR